MCDLEADSFEGSDRQSSKAQRSLPKLRVVNHDGSVAAGRHDT
jgi:hypothetical protein